MQKVDQRLFNTFSPKDLACVHGALTRFAVAWLTLETGRSNDMGLTERCVDRATYVTLLGALTLSKFGYWFILRGGVVLPLQDITARLLNNLPFQLQRQPLTERRQNLTEIVSTSAKVGFLVLCMLGIANSGHLGLIQSNNTAAPVSGLQKLCTLFIAATVLETLRYHIDILVRPGLLQLPNGCRLRREGVISFASRHLTHYVAARCVLLGILLKTRNVPLAIAGGELVQVLWHPRPGDAQ